MPEFRPRNTRRARELRNGATPAERPLWKHLRRTKYLEQNGYRVIRFMNEDVLQRAESVLAAIAAELINMPAPALHAFPFPAREGR